jgi:hypothetical protein
MSFTLVTGLWDIGRGKLNEGWSRSFDHYLQKFKQLLQVDENMIIFGDNELKKFVFENRSLQNTQFIERELSWFQNNEFYSKIQEIRNNPKWYNQVGWLKESTQAKLELYNPLVMSKVFLLHDAKILDKFDSEYLFWIDAGLTNTVHPGYFTHDKVLEKLPKHIDKFTFVSFPYETSTEIHGFEFNQICEYAGEKVTKVCRGGFFGGPKNTISEINSIYYGLLKNTLDSNLMGTEESIFSIMLYKHSQLIDYFEIDSNGLFGKFFEDIKNELLNKLTFNKQILHNLNKGNVSVYVIGFNSPKQLSTLITSMLEYDKNFIESPKKYLLNNSTDRSTDNEYNKLCEEYGFEIIGTGENLGICGGRQYIAEHFEKSDSDYMFFFEDDMFFYPKQGELCANGFNRYVKDLYKISLDIISKENLDFLKLNFTEFYGDNSTQWSWYNVPQNVRETYWPEKNRLPNMGLDPNAPKTEFKNIKVLDGLPYAIGEVYYCNWPQVVSKTGNKKMFLETKWDRPFEQTWMSHIFQETRKNNITSGLLLLTPTEHNRFDHYHSNLRKES